MINVSAYEESSNLKVAPWNQRDGVRQDKRQLSAQWNKS
jgi:hypothetical protein